MLALNTDSAYLVMRERKHPVSGETEENYIAVAMPLHSAICIIIRDWVNHTHTAIAYRLQDLSNGEEIRIPMPQEPVTEQEVRFLVPF